MIEVSIFHVPMVVVVGFLSGALYARYLRKRNADLYTIASAAVPLTIWVTIAAVNMTGLSPLLVRSTIELPITVAVPYVLSYPLWFRVGGELALVLLGRQPDQGGILWVFRLENGTDEIDPSWSVNHKKDDD